MGTAMVRAWTPLHRVRAVWGCAPFHPSFRSLLPSSLRGTTRLTLMSMHPATDGTYAPRINACRLSKLLTRGGVAHLYGGIMREELRVQLKMTQQRLAEALDSEQSERVSRYRARLKDLIDIANRYGIDVTEWVDQTLLDDAPVSDAATSGVSVDDTPSEPS